MKANAENTGYDSQIPYEWGTAADKFDDANEGWDDYGPYYTPQIAQYYGSLGQTIETPYKTNDGVAQHYWVSWASVKNALDHKWQLADGPGHDAQARRPATSSAAVRGRAT